MNFIRSNIFRKILPLTAALMMPGCGSEGGQQILKNFSFALDENEVGFEAEFGAETSLNVEVSAPIKNFGTVTFIPQSADKGFRIRTTLDLGAFVDEEIVNLRKTQFLPNGRPFHDYVQTQLAQLEVKRSSNMSISAYFGLESGYRYVGAAAELDFIDGDFPAGLTISQQILNRNNQPMGVVTIYGPQIENGEVTRPGGLFVVTRLEDLRGSSNGFTAMSQSDSGINPYPGFDVEGPNAHQYDDNRELYKLFKLYRKKADNAGMLD